MHSEQNLQKNKFNLTLDQLISWIQIKGSHADLRGHTSPMGLQAQFSRNYLALYFCQIPILVQQEINIFFSGGHSRLSARISLQRGLTQTPWIIKSAEASRNWSHPLSLMISMDMTNHCKLRGNPRPRKWSDTRWKAFCKEGSVALSIKSYPSRGVKSIRSGSRYSYCIVLIIYFACNLMFLF